MVGICNPMWGKCFWNVLGYVEDNHKEDTLQSKIEYHESYVSCWKMKAVKIKHMKNIKILTARESSIQGLKTRILEHPQKFLLRVVAHLEIPKLDFPNPS